MLGFQPAESLVVVPLHPGPPVARVDLPDTAGERDLVTDQLLNAYRRHAQPDSQLTVMCFSEDLRAAEFASQHLSAALTAHGIEVPAPIWITDDAWADLNTGQGGPRTRKTQVMITAEFVVAGRQAPASGRDELAMRLVGEPRSARRRAGRRPGPSGRQRRRRRAGAGHPSDRPVSRRRSRLERPGCGPGCWSPLRTFRRATAA
jgi:hypothetical protein